MNRGDHNFNIKIIVCAHKQDYIHKDSVYMPIQVGKAISDIDLGIQGDDTGDNISSKNKSYCELTALYWAWKNLKDIDYIGINHYRRYFNFYESGLYCSDYKVVSANEIKYKDLNIPNIKKLFANSDIVVAKKKYYPYNLMTDYSCCHISEDFRKVREVIVELYPTYINAFDKVMIDNNKLSHYNMFVTSWTVFDNYCQWLFTILEEVERRIDISSYNSVQKRIFGYMSERLMAIYIEANNLRHKEYPIYWVNDNAYNHSFIYRFLYRLKCIIVFPILKIHSYK